MNDNNLGAQTQPSPAASFFRGDGKHIFLCLALTLLGLCLTAVGGVIPAIPAALFGTALFAVATVADKKQLFSRVFLVGVFAASLILFGSITKALLLICLFFPAGLALAFSVKKEYNLNDAVIRMALATGITLIITGLFWLMEYGTDMDFSSLFKPLNESVKFFFGEFYDTLQSNNVYGYLLPVKEDFIYSAFRLTVASVPVAVAEAVLAVDVTAYWLVKKIFTVMNRTEPDRVKFFGAFIYVRISKVGAAVYMISSILTLLSSNGADTLFFSTVESVMSAVFCYAGIALVGFFMKMRGWSAPLRIAVYVILTVLCILPVGLANIVSMLGFIDSFWHLRRFIRSAGARTL